VSNEHCWSISDLQMTLSRGVIANLYSSVTSLRLEHIYLIVANSNLAEPPNVMADKEVNSQHLFLRLRSRHVAHNLIVSSYSGCQ